MKIFADENMPLVEELFTDKAQLLQGPGRSLTKDQLTGVQVLLVRSVTKVNADLLAGTSVQFVGSATAGIDHIDQQYLANAGIEFAYAPGCNANSVAEYVVAAILDLAIRDGFELAGKSIGIVGHGQVGSRVAAKCRVLDMQVLINDPPLQDQGAKLDFVDLDDLLSADILTLHVPLTTDGKYPTAHIINNNWLERITKPKMMLLNTCRGGVVDEQALWLAKTKGSIAQVILDVYEAEKTPQRISDTALTHADLTTPHIAGYSYDGKATGTLMLYQALATRYAWPTLDDINPLETQTKELTGPNAHAGYLEQLTHAVCQAYYIQQDHQNLQQAITHQGPQRGAYFDSLRKNYPIRREFKNYRVFAEQGYSAEAVETLKELGFEG